MSSDIKFVFSSGVVAGAGALSERDNPHTDQARQAQRVPSGGESPAPLTTSRSESVSFTARNPGRPRTLNWDRMNLLRAQGWSYARIGRLFGVNHTSVMYACDPAFRERRKNANKRRAKVATHGSTGYIPR